MALDLEPQASLPWLVRLRWLSLGAQVVALASARFWFGILLPVWPLALVLASAGASNGVLAYWLSRRPAAASAGAVVGSMLSLDTVLLTLLLGFSGGPMNPFTVLYLVHITLSAVVLGAHWTTWIAGLGIACFGLLYAIPKGIADPHAHAALMTHHLQGMWLAFTQAALLTAYFVRRIATTIAAQREHIAILREAAARNGRLASLTTLAAGAAHELGTPLGTIAVAAHEIEIAAGDAAPAVVEDARLIVEEVERCHEILKKMGSRADAEHARASEVSLNELERLLRARFDNERARRIHISAENAVDTIRAPLEELMHSLYALVKNALDATAEDQSVRLLLASDALSLRISVQDAGSGMPAAVLARAGEPFFTTKDPGRGLGLGLFLTRAFAESQGGELVVESEVGRGTRATLRLPLNGARIA